MAWLHDDVFSIRTAAAENLTTLAGLLGVEWATAVVVPQLTAMATRGAAAADGTGGVCGAGPSGTVVPEHPSTHRLMALRALQALAPALGGDLAAAHVVPALAALCADPVPNVRFNAARALASVAPVVGPAVAASAIKPQLTSLLDDGDRDVKYFAATALAELGA